MDIRKEDLGRLETLTGQIGNAALLIEQSISETPIDVESIKIAVEGLKAYQKGMIAVYDKYFPNLGL